MNPADKRLSELLDKWLTSLELHLKYSALDDGAYRRVQPWPAHERPSRWIIELGLQKVRQLHEQLAARVQMGDAKFAEALELMGFLTNLVGSQHIRRFIPLAEPQTEVDPAAQTDTAIAPPDILEPIDLPPAPAETAQRTVEVAHLRKPPADEGTREMTRPKIAAARPPARREAKSAGSKARGAQRTASDRDRQVLEDAKRLLGWGRKWHELPELISRMAGRPPVTDVRRVLREHKSTLQ